MTETVEPDLDDKHREFIGIAIDKFIEEMPDDDEEQMKNFKEMKEEVNDRELKTKAGWAAVLGVLRYIDESELETGDYKSENMTFDVQERIRNAVQ